MGVLKWQIESNGYWQKHQKKITILIAIHNRYLDEVKFNNEHGNGPIICILCVRDCQMTQSVKEFKEAKIFLF